MEVTLRWDDQKRKLKKLDSSLIDSYKRKSYTHSKPYSQFMLAPKLHCKVFIYGKF